MTLYLTLFLAGMLTILLPCILPLVPVVLGVSIAGHSRWRPLFTVLGMVISFVGFTFLLLLVLNQFVFAANLLRISTFNVLWLFGLGFVFHDRRVTLPLSALGGLFFWNEGPVATVIAAGVGMLCMMYGGQAASYLQQFGTSVQSQARADLGVDNPLTALVVGLSLGLIWVPCAGPALGFAFTLVRDEPGLRAALALTSYALGTAVPLLLVGYGGQYAVSGARKLVRYSGLIKQISGGLLLFTAVALHLHWFEHFQVWLIGNTPFGDIGTRLEERLFEKPKNAVPEKPSGPVSSLPILGRAPEWMFDGEWLNSQGLTAADLQGKVVLIDFWTYSCINCIRTLPYIQGYWETFQDRPFVLIGVHAPEFVFERDKGNVADAIKRYGLTYPVVQDNDFTVWKSFDNQYWPAKYLIDPQGNIRYKHFGEGEYGETEAAIVELLREMGSDAPPAQPAALPPAAARPPISKETYVGDRGWDFFANSLGAPDTESHSYTRPSQLPLHEYALVGTWQLSEDKEHQTLRSDQGEVRMRFLGGEINLVMGMKNGSAPAQVAVQVDGEAVKTFGINRKDIFPLWKGEYGEHEIVLRITGEGAEAYAFTFGR